jgi:hypothetical protein
MNPDGEKRRMGRRNGMHRIRSSLRDFGVLSSFSQGSAALPPG